MRKKECEGEKATEGTQEKEKTERDREDRER